MHHGAVGGMCGREGRVRVRAGEGGGEQQPAQLRAQRTGHCGLVGLVRHHANREAPLGQRAGLVGTGDVDAAQGLNRGDPAHQDLVLAQPSRRTGLTDAGQQRQAFGNRGKRGRHADSQLVHPRPAPDPSRDAGHSAAGERQRQRHSEDLGEPHAHRADLVAIHAQGGRGRAEPRVFADRDHDGPAGARDDVAPFEEDAVRFGVGVGPLGNRQRLAGQRRLTDLQPGAIEQPGVGSDAIAGRQRQDVARHHIADRHGQRRTVAQDASVAGAHARQRLGRHADFALLPDTGRHVHADGQGDDGRVERLAEHEGQAGAAGEDARDRCAELIEQRAQKRVAHPGRHRRRAAGSGLGATQPQRRRGERAQHFAGARTAPLLGPRVRQERQCGSWPISAAQPQPAVSHRGQGSDMDAVGGALHAELALEQAEHAAEHVRRHRKKHGVVHDHPATCTGVEKVGERPQVRCQQVGAGRELAGIASEDADRQIARCERRFRAGVIGHEQYRGSRPLIGANGVQRPRLARDLETGAAGNHLGREGAVVGSSSRITPRRLQVSTSSGMPSRRRRRKAM